MNIKTKVTSQENDNKKIGKYNRKNNQIVTDQPKAFTATSGLFKPPSSLLFGFKPMTAPASFPTTARPRTKQGRFNPPRNLRFGFIPSSDSFFGRINNFFQPISTIIKG